MDVVVDRAQEIIDELMNDEQAYRRASARESEIWGRVFSDEDRSRRQAADSEAAARLGVYRDRLELPAVLRELGIEPRHGCSLACGSGRAERALLEAGVCTSFHGIDISADALEVGRRTAAAAGLDITYEQADLNHLRLAPDTFDLVVAQSCLHHVLRLEDLADEIACSLRPGGVLWIADYVGETQFQYTDERIELANYLIGILPERYRYDTVNRRLVERVVRKEPGNLASPFEAIRSADILPVFLERFDVVTSAEYNAVLHLVTTTGTSHVFCETDTSRALYETLYLLDRLLLDLGVLSPTGGQYLLRPKVT